MAKQKRTFDYWLCLDAGSENERDVKTSFRLRDPEEVVDFINGFLYDGVDKEGRPKEKEYRVGTPSNADKVLQLYIKNDVKEFFAPYWIEPEVRNDEPVMKFDEFIDKILSLDLSFRNFVYTYRAACIEATFPGVQLR